MVRYVFKMRFLMSFELIRPSCANRFIYLPIALNVAVVKLSALNYVNCLFYLVFNSQFVNKRKMSQTQRYCSDRGR